MNHKEGMENFIAFKTSDKETNIKNFNTSRLNNHPHFIKPKEFNFYASQKEKSSILISGLTEAHEEMLLGHFRSFGHKIERMPTPDFDSFQIGKEYCNRGQCNPAYYTIGNLIKYLQQLARETSIEKVEKKYVFFTVGGCGPCRFGMYESEYRKALKDAGFANFRLFIVQQSGGLKQIARIKEADDINNQNLSSDESPGIVVDREFIFGLVIALLIGDCLNQMVDKLKPYEVDEGAAMRAREKAMTILRKGIEEKRNMFVALRKVKKLFDQVECDFMRIKPLVKITGEFWASSTEGQGNYFLKNWLQREGAEVTQEPLTGWLEYLLFIDELSIKDRRNIAQTKTGLKNKAKPYIKLMKNFALRQIIKGYYNLYRAALGFKLNNTVNKPLLARYAHEYFNTRIQGGEGYMEVGSLIHCAKKNKAHMLISVKPFGCMPSTGSDGIQSKVLLDYPNIIFLSVETSGDSEVNFKSRVQMKLFEAKQKAKEEFETNIKKNHIDLDLIKEFVAGNPQYRRGTFFFNIVKTGTGISYLVKMNRRLKSPIGRIWHFFSKSIYNSLRLSEVIKKTLISKIKK